MQALWVLGKRHMMSMQSVLASEGYYRLCYRDVFEILSLHSDQPGTDMLEMFRQLTRINPTCFSTAPPQIHYNQKKCNPFCWALVIG